MSRDEGSATVWVLVAGAVLIGASVLGLLVGAATGWRHRAATAADMAALAAAGRALDGPGPACAAAASAAERNGARLVRCDLTGAVATVVTSVAPAGWLGRFGTTEGRARAGPVDDPGETGRLPAAS